MVNIARSVACGVALILCIHASSVMAQVLAKPPVTPPDAIYGEITITTVGPDGNLVSQTFKKGTYIGKSNNRHWYRVQKDERWLYLWVKPTESGQCDDQGNPL